MLENMTIAQLKALVSDMNLRSQNGDMKVTSKMRKADIIEMVMAEIDRLHDEATAENEFAKNFGMDRLTTFNGKSESKSYNTRMISRLETYARQNGYGTGLVDIYADQHLTARQRRRVNKKYNAQYAKLSRKLTA